MRLIDITGLAFGSLRVLSRDLSAPKNRSYWICKCTCGTQLSADAYRLREGHATSCGCNVGRSVAPLNQGKRTCRRCGDAYFVGDGCVACQRRHSAANCAAQIKVRQRDYYFKNRARLLILAADYRRKEAKRIRTDRLSRARAQRLVLDDNYIKELAYQQTGTVTGYNQALAEKREQLLLHRFIRSVKRELKEHIKRS